MYIFDNELTEALLAETTTRETCIDQQIKAVS